MALLFVLLCILSHSDEPIYRGPQCLGMFCVNQSVALADLTAQIGTPERRLRELCFQSADGGVYLSIRTIHNMPNRAGAVLLSDFPSCLGMAARVTERGKLNWTTKEGIGLGSHEEEVRRLYGKPYAEEKVSSRTCSVLLQQSCSPMGKDIVIGDRSLFYSGLQFGTKDDYASAQIGLRGSRVSWILLSTGE